MPNLLPRIFATALIVLGAYEAALRIAAPNVNSSPDQYTANAIRLESYVDGGARAPAVIVGSSLSARIPSDAWPQGWRVLSQADGSALTGLSVVAATHPLPARVLIEANFLDSGADPADIENATGAVPHKLRAALWLTRRAFRPMNIIVWALRRLSPSDEAAPANFPQILKLQQNGFAKAPDAGARSRLVPVKALVDRLQQEGVRIAFFEMPVDASLGNMPFASGRRALYEMLFPKSTYCWLLIAGTNWQTIDGIHLLARDGRKAAAAIAAAACEGGV